MVDARRAAVCFVLICTITSASVSTASAFCRTRTVAADPDHDSTKRGCPSEGNPLFWRNACIGYSMQSAVSQRVSYEDAAGVMSTAFTRWTGATCPTDGHGSSRVSIDVRDLGPAECAVVKYLGPRAANQNVIIFRDEGWEHGPEVLGLTTVNFDPETGELFNADMELNTQDMTKLAVRDPVDADAYDFASVATHEAGHFLGMAHSDVKDTTMYARYDKGQTDMRYLAPDDVAGICTVYRPDGTRAVLDHYETQAPQCDPTPRGGYSSKCQEKPKCSASSRPTQTRFALVGGLAMLAAFAWRRKKPASS